MATLNVNDRKSFLLSVTPINYSLTEGTNIPPPSESPRHSPSLFEPPTPGGGPLSSHPTGTPNLERQNPMEAITTTSRERADSFRTPTSPASAAQLSTSPNAQKPKGVRKLLSLTSLRSSFNSSRTSLSQPRASNDTTAMAQASSNSTYTTKRPASPGAASSFAPSTVASLPGRPPLREKKSGNWFKRKSSLFLLNGDLDTVDESGAGTRPDTRESKRLKSIDSTPPPLLPDIGALGGGGITGGDLGWDEKAFKRDITA